MESLQGHSRIISKANTSRHVILPALEAATGSAAITTAGPMGIVVNGQGVERRPAIVMTPLCDLAQVFTGVGFEMWQSSKFAEIAVRDNAQIDAGGLAAL